MHLTIRHDAWITTPIITLINIFTGSKFSMHLTITLMHEKQYHQLPKNVVQPTTNYNQNFLRHTYNDTTTDNNTQHNSNKEKTRNNQHSLKLGNIVWMGFRAGSWHDFSCDRVPASLCPNNSWNATACIQFYCGEATCEVSGHRIPGAPAFDWMWLFFGLWEFDDSSGNRT